MIQHGGTTIHLVLNTNYVLQSPNTTPQYVTQRYMLRFNEAFYKNLKLLQKYFICIH